MEITNLQQGRKKARFKSNARKGIFLGFLPHTTKIVMYYGVNSQEIKYATHLRCEKGMNDLPFEEIPLSVQHLQRKEDGKRILPENDFQSTDQLHFFVEPFVILVTHHFNNVCPEHKSLDFTLCTDQLSN